MKVYIQFYRKTALSLIAEMGGYLGLFLGWSGLAFVAFFESYLKQSGKPKAKPVESCTLPEWANRRSVSE